MRRHLFHQFTKVDRLVGAMDLQEEGEVVTSNILDLHQATLSTRGHHQIILGHPPGIHTTLGHQLEIQPTILGLLPASNGPNHPLVQLEEHTHQGDTMAPQVETIHLKWVYSNIFMS